LFNAIGSNNYKAGGEAKGGATIEVNIYIMKVCCLNARIIYGIVETHLYNPEEALFF
jgi:hypothetical protein